MNKLSNQILNVSVPAKAILIGEHSVVFGHTAIAIPLSDITLTLTIGEKTFETWEEVWDLWMCGSSIELTDHFRSLLTQSFKLAVSLFKQDIRYFTPQLLSIRSHIPLGGGMGGSAAIAASFIRLCEKIFNSPLDIKTEIEWANQIDSLFHSNRASGLDVTTILTQQLIQYNKSDSFKIIQSECPFYVALIDTKERSETSKMIEIVSDLMQKNDENALTAMRTLGCLALECVDHLKNGDLNTFTKNINRAQSCLEQLHVSTGTIETFCKELLSYGALGAKLTGAGGGGLVLAIFRDNPEFLKEKYKNFSVFITPVHS